MLQTFKKVQQITLLVVLGLLVYAAISDASSTTVSGLLVWFVIMLQGLSIVDLQIETANLQDQISNLKYRLFKERQD